MCRALHSGLRSSALLALLSSSDSASDSDLCPVSPESSQELSTTTDTSSLPGSTAAICSPSSPRDKVILANESYTYIITVYPSIFLANQRRILNVLDHKSKSFSLFFIVFIVIVDLFLSVYILHYAGNALMAAYSHF